jgi:hypothetical protein
MVPEVDIPEPMLTRFSTLLIDLRAANVFEIAEFSFQVVPVL